MTPPFFEMSSPKKLLGYIEMVTKPLIFRTEVSPPKNNFTSNRLLAAATRFV